VLAKLIERKAQTMNDLISRQAVIDLLKKSASRDIEEVVVTEKNIKLIMDMPKAYDVDAVIEQLEEESFPTHENYSAIWLDKATTIVKRGGVE
jgi:hypothetical protein